MVRLASCTFIVVAFAAMCPSIIAQPTKEDLKAANDAALLWAVPMRFKFDAHMVAQIAFSPDGKYLAAVATDVNLASALRIHDIAADKEHLNIGGATWGYRCIAFTSDSKKIIAAGHGNTAPLPQVIRAFALDKGTELHVLKGFAAEAITLQMLPGDKTLASLHNDGTVRYWDLAASKETRAWKSPLLRHAGVSLGKDGVTLALTRDDNSVELWDALAGVRLRQLARHKDRTSRLTFSTDGRLLARIGDLGKSMQIYETASGLVRHEIARQLYTPMWAPLTFSPDNSMLAWSDKTGANNAGVLMRLSDNKILLQDYGYWRYTVAFSRDGTQMAAGQGKTNWMNLWEIPNQKPAKAKPLAESALESLWADLLDAKDAVKAYRVMQTLIEAQAVDFLRTKLASPKTLDRKVIEKLIADLGSDDPLVVEEADIKLQNLGSAAAVALREALQTNPAGDTRRHLERLWSRLDGPLSGERLRSARAIEVLERIASRGSRDVLQSLANDSPLSESGADAKRALERLGR